MVSTALLLLLVLHFELGKSAHEHQDEDHYAGQQHNPEHDMKVLLGDQDTEVIKNLSPAQQKIKIVEIIKKIDANADKLLNAEELTAWIQHVYRKYALDDAKERFPEFDTDADGTVSWEEYRAVSHGQLSFDEPTDPADPEKESLRFLQLKERRRFDFADADGTPGLNVTEFLAFIHPAEVDRMADFTIEDVLAEYDSDKDGLISLSEFIGDLRGDEDTPSRWEIEETVRFKDLYDQDKDGTLDREEQLRWVAPNSYGSAREEAVHLVAEMDLDGDGQISEAEVLKNQETFLNSEVTDYGRQLHLSHDEL